MSLRNNNRNSSRFFDSQFRHRGNTKNHHFPRLARMPSQNKQLKDVITVATKTFLRSLSELDYRNFPLIKYTYETP